MLGSHDVFFNIFLVNESHNQLMQARKKHCMVEYMFSSHSREVLDPRLCCAVAIPIAVVHIRKSRKKVGRRIRRQPRKT
jgi:hypothetical protein